MGRHASRRGALLSREVHAVSYTHADDGRDYRHEFGAGVRATLHPDGAVTLRHRDGRPLWADVAERPYLVNPDGERAMARKRKRSKRRDAGRTAKRTGARRRRPPPAGFASWKTYMASIRPTSKRRRASSARKRSRSGASTEEGSMARKRKSARRRSAGRAQSTRRRRYRRNPPAFRGIVGQLAGAGIDAVQLVVAKGVTRAVPQMLNLPQTGAMGMAVQAGVGLAGAMVVERIKRGAGRLFLTGALMGLAESGIKRLNIPILSPALGDPADYYMGVADGMAAYPEQALSGYPQYVGPQAMLGQGDEQLSGYEYQQQVA